MNNKAVLSVENISKYYPGVIALDKVTFDIYEGEVHALLGENGAGKSTLIKVIAGAIEPDQGVIRIGDREYKKTTPKESRACHIEVIYQEFNLVPSLSVAENIFLGSQISSKRLVNLKAMEKNAQELFEKIGISINPKAKVRELTPAQQELVEISKAIVKDVKILIMDEPTAPLTVHEVDLLFNIVRSLKERGVTIIYISHRLEEIFEICDRVTVMRDGQYIATKNIKETNRAELIKLMVGRNINTSFPVRHCVEPQVVLKAEHLTGNGVRDVSFELHKGEILGLAGLVGSGRTEIVRVLYGAEKKELGNVEVHGKVVAIKKPSDAMRYGIGLIPEDRKGQGLFLGMSVKWNALFNSLRSISRWGIVNNKKEAEIASFYCDKMHIKTPSLTQKVMHLSGGNQQKVVIAKTLAAKSEIIVFDEPTRGIDVAAKQEIYKLMSELVENGSAIIMISSDMEELLGMSDRILVLSEGVQVGMVEPRDFRQDFILDLASGDK